MTPVRSDDELAFSSARSELPMIYTFFALAGIELLTVHLLASLWSRTVAWVFTATTILAVVQIAMIVHRLKRSPTLVTARGLVVRSAKGREITLPWSDIVRIEGMPSGPPPTGSDVWKTSIIAYPNIVVVAGTPIAVRRLGRTLSIRTLLLRADDAQGLLKAAHLHRIGAVPCA